MASQSNNYFGKYSCDTVKSVFTIDFVTVVKYLELDYTFYKVRSR